MTNQPALPRNFPLPPYIGQATGSGVEGVALKSDLTSW